MKQLTDRQRRFVTAYIDCWNGTKAAEVAGYSHPMQAGYNLLNNEVISTALAREIADRAAKSDEALLQLVQIARLNVADFYRFGWRDKILNGRPVLDAAGQVVREYTLIGVNNEMIKQYGHLIKRVTERNGRVVIDFHDSQYALYLIAKALGLMRETKHQVNTRVSPDDYAQARQKMSRFSEVQPMT